MKKILVIDDDARVSGAIGKALSGKYQVTVAHSGEEGLACATCDPPDLILLDLHMPPGANGLEVCRRLREHAQLRVLPLVMMTGDDDVSRKVEGLMTGADDFLSKPFNMQELEARIVARLRRHAIEADRAKPIEVGNLKVDPVAAGVRIGEAPVDLTHLEFRILQYFVSSRDQLVTRRRMLSDLWPNSVVSRRTIDTHVANLRKKLAGFDGTLETVYGGGYILRGPRGGAEATLT